MKLSTRARYGLRICFLMAVSEEKVTLPQIVARTDLSKKYLEQILSKNETIVPEGLAEDKLRSF